MAGTNLEGQLISQVKLDPQFETLTLQMMQKLANAQQGLKFRTGF